MLDLFNRFFADVAYFDGNNITGSMPAELCSASSLFADCADISCLCCTYCCEDGEDCEWNGTGEEPVGGDVREELPFRIFPTRPNPPSFVHPP